MAKADQPETLPSVLPILPIRNAVLFPSISMPLVVGRERSLKALDQAAEDRALVVVLAQKVLTPGDPDPSELYRIGTLCKLENITRNESGNCQVVVTGVARFKVDQIRLDPGGYLTARGATEPDEDEGEADGEGASDAEAGVTDRASVRRDAIFYQLKELAREVLELLPGATDPLVRLVDRVDDPTYLTYVCAAYLNLPVPRKQELLEEARVEARMRVLLGHMRKEREVLCLQREIRDKMAERLNKAQREALLREQVRTIRTELGEESDEGEVDTLEQKIDEAHLSPEARRQADEELKRIRNLPSSSAEHHVIRTYLEWMAALPWDRVDESRVEIARARRVLDEDHTGLEKVKKRIVQHLAVSQLKQASGERPRAPLICLVGPPGVGKTSLGKSIARALDRKFVRCSFGGVRDEAEIRGHRRTYVGAMPGRILQSLKRAGSRNPVMLLDEIDKLRADFQGDPAAALLEVLDPEQNNTFTDHYLDVPFDLSEILFIATANSLDTIPPPLLDRMEIIEVSGYTMPEKLAIARDHLVPRLLGEHGLKPDWVELPDETIQAVIGRHTREAGVRDLQRKIAALFRAAAEETLVSKQAGLAKPERIHLTERRLRELLGPDRHLPEPADQSARPGVATGLAWTPHGGDILHIETILMPQGHGTLILTGQLGDVMKESAQIALSLARVAKPGVLIPTDLDLSRYDLHIHVPAGAIPKDGPSAGITLLAALASLLTGRPIRPSIAMTGEITLRGTVLPVGGIKEKVLAAHRAGIRTIILPIRNAIDLTEVPEAVRAEMEFVTVETIEEALARVLSPVGEPGIKAILPIVPIAPLHAPGPAAA